MYNYTQLDPEKCEFIPIAPVEEILEGERLFVEIDGQSIVVLNLGGEYFAIADLCSHDDGPLGDGELEGYKIHCPRHGASFDIRSGKVHSLPAIVDIPAFPVQVVEGKLEIGLPLD